jgi:hypothetical protein
MAAVADVFVRDAALDFEERRIPVDVFWQVTAGILSLRIALTPQ